MHYVHLPATLVFVQYSPKKCACWAIKHI